MGFRSQLAIAVLALATAAWLVLAFLEGDACSDAGGSFRTFALQCFVAEGQDYVPLTYRGHWPFWAFYGVAATFVAGMLFALFSGLVAGLCSLWTVLFSGQRA